MSQLINGSSARELAVTGGATAYVLAAVKAPSNHRVPLKKWGIYFNGTSATNEPVEVRLIRFTSDGALSDVTSGQAKQVDDDCAQSIRSTFFEGPIDSSTLGTLTTLKRVRVHPQFGYEVSDANEIIGGGDRMGVEVLAANSVNAEVWMQWQE